MVTGGNVTGTDRPAGRRRPGRARGRLPATAAPLCGSADGQRQARVRRHGGRARTLGDRDVRRDCPAASATGCMRCWAARRRHAARHVRRRTRRARMSMNEQLRPFAAIIARTHFRWEVDADAQGGDRSRSNRPERKNPLTSIPTRELRDLFRGLVYASDVKCVVVTGAGGNFSSGGDVHEIIGPLTKMAMPELLAFTRMTGDLVLAMRALPAADRRRGRRRVRGRRRDGGACRPTCASAPPRRRPRSCSCASDWPVATWAPARCCRAYDRPGPRGGAAATPAAS